MGPAPPDPSFRSVHEELVSSRARQDRGHREGESQVGNGEMELENGREAFSHLSTPALTWGKFKGLFLGAAQGKPRCLPE